MNAFEQRRGTLRQRHSKAWAQFIEENCYALVPAWRGRAEETPPVSRGEDYRAKINALARERRQRAAQAANSTSAIAAQHQDQPAS